MSQSFNQPIAQSSSPSIPQSESQPRELSRLQRLEIYVLGWLAAWIVRLIGTSLRWEVHGWEHWEAARASSGCVIYAFWHSEIFAATWFWRNRGVFVMSGYNFDARFTARVIQKLGYHIARGSASRGAARALVSMVRAVQRGHDAAFTIDGPRGPRHVAKAGAVMLAKATGAPIVCFHIRTSRAWVFRKSWDRTEIPHPFSRAALFVAPGVSVSKEADDAEQSRKLAEMQSALDDLVRQGDEWLKKIG